MKLDVRLPSGDGCCIEVSPSRSISELKAAAQQHFKRRLKLIAIGRQLDSTATLSEAGFRDGDVVAAVVQLGQLAATFWAFALHRHENEVVTWGEADHGGDSSQVKKQLRNVQRIQATNRAFAAMLESGAVVSCGHPRFGGDSSQVQEQLRNVQHIQATNRAFAAILESGAVVTWGDPRCGGDSSEVQDQLRNVQHIHALTLLLLPFLSLGML